MVSEIASHGVRLTRYGTRLDDIGFVRKLLAATLRAAKKRRRR
jgi:hypothetical protein